MEEERRGGGGGGGEGTLQWLAAVSSANLHAGSKAKAEYGESDLHRLATLVGGAQGASPLVARAAATVLRGVLCRGGSSAGWETISSHIRELCAAGESKGCDLSSVLERWLSLLCDGLDDRDGFSPGAAPKFARVLCSCSKELVAATFVPQRAHVLGSLLARAARLGLALGSLATVTGDDNGRRCDNKGAAACVARAAAAHVVAVAEKCVVRDADLALFSGALQLFLAVLSGREREERGRDWPSSALVRAMVEAAAALAAAVAASASTEAMSDDVDLDLGAAAAFACPLGGMEAAAKPTGDKEGLARKAAKAARASRLSSLLRHSLLCVILGAAEVAERCEDIEDASATASTAATAAAALDSTARHCSDFAVALGLTAVDGEKEEGEEDPPSVVSHATASLFVAQDDVLVSLLAASLRLEQALTGATVRDGAKERSRAGGAAAAAAAAAAAVTVSPPLSLIRDARDRCGLGAIACFASFCHCVSYDSDVCLEFLVSADETGFLEFILGLCRSLRAVDSDNETDVGISGGDGGGSGGGGDHFGQQGNEREQQEATENVAIVYLMLLDLRGKVGHLRSFPYRKAPLLAALDGAIAGLKRRVA